jgi:hypothetical protein
MRESKHTPGPWRVEEGPFFAAIRADAAGVSGIASIQLVSPSTAQAIANAHLISAAPEMLFVLKEVEWAADGEDALGWTVPCCPFCAATKAGGAHFDFCALSAAISKAEGRS